MFVELSHCIARFRFDFCGIQDILHFLDFNIRLLCRFQRECSHRQQCCDYHNHCHRIYKYVCITLFHRRTVLSVSNFCTFQSSLDVCLNNHVVDKRSEHVHQQYCEHHSFWISRVQTTDKDCERTN